MAATDLDPADLEAIATQLKAAGPLRAASFDPSAVTMLPGAWLRFDGFRPAEQLASTTLAVTVFLVVPDNGIVRSLGALEGLFNALHPTLIALGEISDQVRTTGLSLPVSQTPLPAFAIPLSIITVKE